MKKTMMLAAVAAATLVLKADYKPEEWNLKAREAFAGRRCGVFMRGGF